MQSRLRLRPHFLMVVLVSIIVPLAAQTNDPEPPRIIEFNAPGAIDGTAPVSINAKGAITGLFYDANDNPHGFLRNCTFQSEGEAGACDNDDSNFVEFDPPGSVFGTYALSINSKKAIAGYYNDSAFRAHGFVRNCDREDPDKACDGDDSTIITFDPPGSLGTQALAIDSKGAITGNYLGSDTTVHGFLRTCAPKAKDKDCFYTSFDVPGALSTLPNSINSRAGIAGSYLDDFNASHGFIRKPEGNIITFDVPAALGTSPQSINRYGATTGYFYEATGGIGSFVRDADGTITTFTVPGADSTFAYGINDAGVIAGAYVANFVAAGFIRDADGILSIFQVPNGLVNVGQMGINNHGAITGSAGNFPYRGFVRLTGTDAK